MEEEETKKVFVRDIIHGMIDITKEKGIIDTKLFQRLRRVSQTGLVNLVFIGAEGTRFSHSIGAMFIAKKYCKKLKKELISKGIDYKYFKKVTAVCALLHDIGHGPFSHSFDRSVFSLLQESKSEESETEKVPKNIYTTLRDPQGSEEKIEKYHDRYRMHLLSKNQELKKAVEDYGVNIEDVMMVWFRVNNNRKKEGFLGLIADITQGIVGADRLDFIKRDSVYTGMQHFGYIDYDRIIQNTYINTEIRSGFSYFSLKREEKVQGEVDNILRLREYFYENVYFHKTVKKYETLLEEIFVTFFKTNPVYLKKVEEEFETIDDSILSIIFFLGDDETKKNVEHILYRTLH